MFVNNPNEKSDSEVLESSPTETDTAPEARSLTGSPVQLINGVYLEKN